MASNKKYKIFFNIFLLSIVFVLVFFSITYIFGNYAGAFQTKIFISNQEKIDFDETIVINFSDNMITNNFSKYIEIEPATKVNYIWENSNKTLKISPENNWKLEENYSVKINGLKNILLVNSSEKLNFNTVSYPKVSNFYPKNNAKDIIIDIESPGIINFNKSLDDFNLKISVFPDKKLNYNINDEKSVVHFAFEGGYERGQEYQITLFIKHKKEDDKNYHKIYKTVFQTEAPLPEEWDKDFETRIEQARKFTVAKIKDDKYVDINLNIQVLTIFENGKVIDSFLISSGKRGMDTPKGNFKISNKHPRPWSGQYGLYMPYWMAIVPSGKFGIHELPEWPGGYKEGQDHLGTPVSHGCVRLGIGAANKVYNWVEIGTPIVIY